MWRCGNMKKSEKFRLSVVTIFALPLSIVLLAGCNPYPDLSGNPFTGTSTSTATGSDDVGSLWTEALVITGNHDYSYAISYDGDEDWFRIDADPALYDYLDVLLYNLPYDYDIYIYAYDSSQNIIYRVGSGENTETADENPVVDLVANPTDADAGHYWYYLRVLCSTGDYSLTETYTINADIQ